MSSRFRAALPILVLVAHAALYGAWIIDDAGITFAYARSFVEGHGFVAQPGDPPVEGFTNILWLLVLAGPMAIGLFDPVLTPKVLGVGCAAGALWIARRAALRTRPDAAVWIDAGAIATAANPAFAIWVASGLENGLTALLAALACSSLARALPRPSTRDAAAAGGLAALLFATRPDGAMYAAVFPVAVLAFGDDGWRRRVGHAAVAATVAVLGFAAVTLWRWLTFGDVVPNTFHAKGGGTSTSAALALLHGAGLGAAILLGPRLRRTRLGDVALLAVIAALLYSMGAQRPLRGLAGPVGWPLTAVALWSFARRDVRPDAALWSFVVMALVQFCALPPDWMGEYRFGTPLVLLGGMAVAGALGSEIRRLDPAPVAWLARGAAVALAAFLVFHFGARALRFRSAPTVPMAEVEARLERFFVAWAAAIGRPDATVLTPDVGGALWRGDLRVVDLAGLCDRRIGTLVRRKRSALAKYIVEDVRPTFVRMHGSHAWWSGLTEEPRFARDYVGIQVWTDEWIRENLGVDVEVGRYVRRDALHDGVTAETLRTVRD